MSRRIRKSDDASPFKRTVAIVGLISAVIAVAIGGYQIVDSIRKALEVKREVQAHIFVADRFFALKNYEAATEEYKKAVSLDNHNITAERGIIKVMVSQLSFTAFVSKYALIDISLRVKFNVAIEDCEDCNLVNKLEVDHALNRVYQLIAQHPSLAQDADLMLNEALMFKAALRLGNAKQVMEQAYKLRPDDPDILGELGLLRGLSRDHDDNNSLPLLRSAVEKRPGDVRYHFYLARTLARSTRYIEAMHEYAQTVRTASDDSKETEAIKIPAQWSLMELLAHSNPITGGNNSKWEISINDLHNIINSVVDDLPDGVDISYDVGDRFLIRARLYYEVGKLQAAYHEIQRIQITHWPDNEPYSCTDAPYLQLYAKILMDGHFDTKTLAAIRSAMQKGHCER